MWAAIPRTRAVEFSGIVWVLLTIRLRIIVCLVCGFRELGLREFGFRELGFRLLIHHQGWEYCLGGWRTCDIVLRPPQLDHVRRDALHCMGERERERGRGGGGRKGERKEERVKRERKGEREKE